MLELRPDAEGQLVHAAAGDSFNTAVYLKRLVPALQVRFVSALGDDMMSGLIRAHMRTHQIDDSLVDTVPGGTAGLYAIETDVDGERRFAYWRAQSAARSMLSPAHLARLHAELPTCRILLITGIALAILDDQRRAVLLALAAQVRDAGGWVVLDNNYRAVLWDAPTAAHWMDRATVACTHALFSFDDEVMLHGDGSASEALARIGAMGVREVVLKLGVQGCLVAQGSGPAVHLPAIETVAVDTTAAGDSFNAGYLAQRMAGACSVSAAQFGCVLAAAVVAHRGAIIPAQAMPDPVLLQGWK